MSTTTTATLPVVSSAINETLRDYQLHHSGRDSVVHAPNIRSEPPRERNPPDWDTTHRRVPSYRPVNRELDQNQRRVYTSGIERTFIFVMFTGVYINATAAQIWRKTGGRLDSTIMRYPVGGEL